MIDVMSFGTAGSKLTLHPDRRPFKILIVIIIIIR